MHKIKTSQKGFTLLELLIVIAILAILSAVTVVVLNPTELLRKARDSQRISDISSIKTAIAFYMTSTSSPSLGTAGTCYVTATASGCTTSVSTSTAVNGTGWIPVNLASLTEGSPLAGYPIDPVNAGGSATPSTLYGYYVQSTPLGFELTANMESAFYKNGGGGDVESKDGGLNANVYETGSVAAFVTSATTSALYPNQ